MLVGGGYGATALFELAGAIRKAGGRSHLLLGAATTDRLYGAEEGGMIADSVTVTTDDGSAGTAGLVTDPLPDLLRRTGADAVYTCGPMPMLRATAAVAAAAGVRCHVSVEEAMACGIGVCMTCVLPIVGFDGMTRMTRACTQGPVFDAGRLRFSDIGTIPADCYGAAAMGAH